MIIVIIDWGNSTVPYLFALMGASSRQALGVLTAHDRLQSQCVKARRWRRVWAFGLSHFRLASDQYVENHEQLQDAEVSHSRCTENGA